MYIFCFNKIDARKIEPITMVVFGKNFELDTISVARKDI